MPDTLRLVSEFYRGEVAVTAIVTQRVYEALPPAPTFPCVRLSRLGGNTRTGAAYWVESVLIQVEAFGGSRSDAWQLAETLRSTIHQSLPGVQPVGDDTAVVTSVEVGGIREGSDPSLPKNDSGTDRHRAMFDAVVTVHPSPASGS